MRALGSLLLHLVQNEKSMVASLDLLQLLPWAMKDEASEVRRRSLTCLKKISKV